MKRTHAERLARALAELDKPCSDDLEYIDQVRYDTARKFLANVATRNAHPWVEHWVYRELRRRGNWADHARRMIDAWWEEATFA